MRDKNLIYEQICRVFGSKRQQIIVFTVGSLFINLSYSVYNVLLGILQKSIWFITTGVYYAILSIMRTIAVRGGHKQDKKAWMLGEIKIMQTTAILLFLLTFTLTGSICLSLKYGLAESYDTITMITITTYTFVKIVMAVINVRKAKKKDSPQIVTIRNIGMSDALVSMLSMQMSMFATFGGEETEKSHIMNIITGAGVCFCIVVIGLSMFYHSKKMKKSLSI